MLRIHFTAEDRCRVRVAGGPHPLWELVLSINGLQSSGLPVRHWAWRNAVGARRRQGAEAAQRLRVAALLVPASGRFADFLTASVSDSDPEAHFDVMLSASKRQVRLDLVRTFHGTPTPSWARRLYAHGRLDGVVDVLRHYCEMALRPMWREVHQHAEISRARYSRHLLDGGVEGLLNGLHSSIRWRGSVLEADYPFEHTVNLAGRGLLVVPTHFCWGAPVTFIDANLPPVLVCPTSDELPEHAAALVSADEVEDRLGKLLGTTRARLLAELAIAGSTSQLATRLGVSLGAISQHTKVLREAGLLTTTRFGASVRHALTPLGRELLLGDSPL